MTVGFLEVTWLAELSYPTRQTHTPSSHPVTPPSVNTAAGLGAVLSITSFLTLWEGGNGNLRCQLHSGNCITHIYIKVFPRRELVDQDRSSMLNSPNSHAAPIQPGGHEHWPVLRSQEPPFWHRHRPEQFSPYCPAGQAGHRYSVQSWWAYRKWCSQLQ